MEGKKKVTLVLNTDSNNETTKENNISFKRKEKYYLTTGVGLENKRQEKSKTKSTRKTKYYGSILDRFSIVYNIPGTGESKEKNYDRITGNIKRIERTMRKEKKAYLKTLRSKNVNNDDISSSDSNKSIDEESDKKNKNNELIKYNILEVIQKFRIPPENRTVEDLYITKNFIIQTKLIENYMEEFNNDKRMIENLATFFGLEFRYQKFQKGEAIYKIDDFSDNFYMVLLGKVDILNVEPKKVNKTGYDYFSYIMNLKKNNEKYRYKLCIEENRKIYPISFDEEDLLPYFFLYFILEDIKEGKKVDNFNKILQLIDIKPREIGLVESKINSMEYILNKEKSIIKKIKNFPRDKIKEYEFIIDKKAKKSVTLFEYKKIKSIDPLYYFGNESIELGTTRSETAICAETTELIYIINKLYITNILPKKAKILEKRTAFLNNNYLFKNIHPKKFVKRYFNLFTLETFYKGDVLFSENDDLEYIYFIKEGYVNLSTSKTILEMEMFINEIDKKIKMVQNIFNNTSNPQEEKNIILYNDIKASSIELFKHIKKREDLKIFILKENEDAGLESYLLGIGSLLTGTVESPKAEIYKIKIDDLTEIMRKEKLCFYELIKRVENKLKIISQRLYEINNTKLSMIDNKITKEFNFRYDLFLKNEKELNLYKFRNSNNTKANTNKIKEIIDIHNSNRYVRTDNNISTLPNLSSKINGTNDNSLDKTKNLENIFQNYNLNENNSKRAKNIFKRKSLLIEEHINHHKAFLRDRVKKMLYHKKKYPFEETLITKINEDINDLLENKFIMTRKSIMNDTYQSSNSRKFNSIDNTTHDDISKANSTNMNNKFLITQVDNYNQKITANNFFTQIKNRFQDNKNKNNFYTSTITNNRNIFNLKNYRNTIFEQSIRYKRKNTTTNNSPTNSNIFDNENIRLGLLKKNNIIQNIEHPYVSPLTLIKLNKYKMIDDEDRFKEEKLRYENNIIKSFKKRGLNQFGYPISYDKTLSRKFNYSINQ